MTIDIAEFTPEMLADLALFPEVEWDRYAGEIGDACAYGWIRPDGERDFLILLFTEAGTGMLTSSAHYSMEFYRRIGGRDEDHRPCTKFSPGDIPAKVDA